MSHCQLDSPRLQIREFLTLLSICHTVVPGESKARLTFFIGGLGKKGANTKPQDSPAKPCTTSQSLLLEINSQG